MKWISQLLGTTALIFFSFSEFAFAEGFINIGLIKKNAIPVRRVIDDVLVVPRTNRVRVGELVVVLRVNGDDVEVIARGSADTIQNGELLVLLDSKSISKLPKVKDWVVSLSKLQPDGEDPPVPQIPDKKIEDAPDPYEPGYMVFEMGPINGHQSSESPNQANFYKGYDSQFIETHFLWYMDFLWRYGIEYQSWGGNLLVKDYYRVEQPSRLEESRIALHYRMLPVWKELRPTLKLVSLSTKFETLNDDEYVLSSNASGMGLGVNFHYLFNDNLYTTTRGFGWAFNKMYFDMNYYPAYTVADGNIKRGTSSSGTMMELKVGATALFYIKAIPWIKRYSVDVSYGISQSQVTFSGDPKSSSDGAYTIPAGQSYSESQSYLKVMFGLRLDDFVSKLMKPR